MARQIFETVKGHLQARGLMLRQGTIVDATIVSAPSSTKNSTGERDPEMHQTRKGNQWYFGMKAHARADAESGLVHSVIGTAANVADVTQAFRIGNGPVMTIFTAFGNVFVTRGGGSGSLKGTSVVSAPNAEPYISNSGGMTRDKITKLIEMTINKDSKADSFSKLFFGIVVSGFDQSFSRPHELRCRESRLKRWEPPSSCIVLTIGPYY